MEDDKVLHNILLKKAKEAEYSSFEIEQINLQTETLFIRYFLEREAAKVVEGTKIEDEVLKKIYDENKEFYTFPEKVKLDTIFVREQDKAEKLLKEVTVENFNELKEKNDEKTDAAQKNVDDNFIFINDIHPAIAEELLKENKKSAIISNLVPVQEGFHIVYLKDKEELVEVFDKVLVAVGRKANTENLGLENTSIELGKFGEVIVDDYLKTNAPNIWAAGDVKGGAQFTYVSLDDFRIIFPQILEGAKGRKLSDRVLIPTSTFIDPPYSRVGINEKEAQRLGIAYTKKFALTNTIPKAHVINETDGFTKILINENNEIIGASICHYESHEMINLLSLAINQKIKANVLKDFIYTHPIFTESLNDILG